GKSAWFFHGASIMRGRGDFDYFLRRDSRKISANSASRLYLKRLSWYFYRLFLNPNNLESLHGC
ncbi:MAG: hypothetical protein ACREUV_05090, partial [Burkholderiales bacterium]